MTSIFARCKRVRSKLQAFNTKLAADAVAEIDRLEHVCRHHFSGTFKDTENAVNLRRLLDAIEG